MTEPTTELPSEVSPGDEDPDAWRDEVAFITPSGPSQWLALPILYVVLGAVGIVLIEFVSRNRALTLQGWTWFVAACAFVAWAPVQAWAGRRAWILYDLEVSMRFVRLKVTAASYLAVVATFAGFVSGSTIVGIIGVVCLFMIRSQREVKRFGPEPSEFRSALARIVERALLVEGIVLMATSLTCGLLAYFLPNDGSQLASRYIGGGIVFFVIGALTTTMALRQRARQATTARV